MPNLHLVMTLLAYEWLRKGKKLEIVFSFFHKLRPILLLFNTGKHVKSSLFDLMNGASKEEVIQRLKRGCSRAKELQQFTKQGMSLIEIRNWLLILVIFEAALHGNGSSQRALIYLLPTQTNIFSKITKRKNKNTKANSRKIFHSITF